MAFLNNLIGAIVGIILGTPLLMLAAKVFSIDTSFQKALTVNALVSIIYFIFSFFAPTTGSIIVLILGIAGISYVYDTSIGTTLGVWIIWVIFSIVTAIILTLLLMAVGFGAAGLFLSLSG